ncbi:polysaccharide lyase family 7 protein [Cellulophaga baltica]|uniref:polysaccharide lyase family 7 protein n=1 Tax=Cellulophaga baltica TaxID=76594 RepID=UPI00041847C9|nr:polysaccharide lyase family 7 protein [Cellulophaga baltica]AIY14809.1 alginate lyase [Cellulophaga baltica NN016038]
MKIFQKYNVFVLIVFFVAINVHSQTTRAVQQTKSKTEVKKNKKKKFKISKIDLSHWKVTLPVANNKGKPIELESPEILDYASNEQVKPYFYNDSTDGSIVFHAFPNTTTANTKYSRSELREQMVPGDNNTNWTFEQGGRMKGKLAIEEVTRDADGKYHRVIIMQIHGRLTNEQKELIGAKDNNAPPILKIYWDKGKIRVKTKVLKNKSVNNTAILLDDAWDDDEGYNFPTEVGFRKFTLEVKVEKGKMVIILNNSEYAVYEGIDINRWNIFENYFKAGNYFQSKDEGSYAKVKYYELEVSH